MRAKNILSSELKIMIYVLYTFILCVIQFSFNEIESEGLMLDSSIFISIFRRLTNTL